MMHIDAGLDGSRASLAALGWAQVLSADSPDVTFHLVHAHHHPLPLNEGAVMRYPQEIRKARENGTAVLEKATRLVEGLKVQLHLVEGVPGRMILEVAASVKADLVAVGRRGLSPIASLFAGSVSTQILHGSKIPVLVANEKPDPHPVRKVLVGIDGSEHSARALSFAAHWTPAAEVTGLHVFRQEDFPPDASSFHTAEAALRGTAVRASELPHRLKAKGAAGIPGEEIVTEFRGNDYDLCVVGSRGLGTLGEIILGSVSESVLRTSPGPVVVTR